MSSAAAASPTGEQDPAGEQALGAAAPSSPAGSGSRVPMTEADHLAAALERGSLAVRGGPLSNKFNRWLAANPDEAKKYGEIRILYLNLCCQMHIFLFVATYRCHAYI